MGADFQIRIGVDGRAAASGVDTIKHKFDHLGAELSKSFLGLFAVDRALEGAKSAIEFGSKIQDMSERLGVGVELLQKWGFGLQQSGGSLDDLTSAFEKFNTARAKAIENPSGSEALAFSKFGLSLDDLKSQRTEEGIKKIFGAFSSGDPQKLIAPFRELIGKSSGALIPALVNGLDTSGSKAEELGIVLDEHVVKNLDRITKSAGTAAAVIKSMFAEGVSKGKDFGETVLDKIHDAFVFTGTFIQRGFTGAAEGGPKTLTEAAEQAKKAMQESASNQRGATQGRGRRRESPRGGAQSRALGRR
jgi:hypothetical protein